MQKNDVRTAGSLSLNLDGFHCAGLKNEPGEAKSLVNCRGKKET